MTARDEIDRRARPGVATRQRLSRKYPEKRNKEEEKCEGEKQEAIGTSELQFNEGTK